MSRQLLLLLRLYIALLLIFVIQKAIFMLVNMGYAGDASFGQCLAVLWHGLRLDSVTACYLLIIPLMALAINSLTARPNMPTSVDGKPHYRRNTRAPYLTLGWYWWPVCALMALAFCADIVLYHFWGAKMDAADLLYAAKPRETLASLHWWQTLLSLTAVALLAWHWRRCLWRAADIAVPPLKHKWHTVALLPVAALLFVGIRGGVSQSTANPSYAYFSPHPFCNHAALNPLFNITHSLFKAENLDAEFHFMEREEAQNTAAPLFATSSAINDTLLRTQRPDILLIIWEGGGWTMTMNDSVAPNMCRLAAEGICFTGCQANNFRTDRGLVSLLSGWQGLPTTSLMKMPDKCRALPGLAATLRADGYTTRFIYGGDIDFTNMRGYLLETGFSEVWGDSHFADSRHGSSWGAPDAYTLLQHIIYPEFSRKPDSIKIPRAPRFDAILTLSSHEPWDVTKTMNRFADPRRNAFAYTDSCLGVLIDSLRQSLLWDNLLVIITADHGVPQSSAQSTSDWRVAHIPIVFIGGAVAKKAHNIDLLMAQSDLPATLLAQLGISHQSYPFSRNVLSPEYGKLPRFAIHAFKNGCNMIDSTGVSRFDCIDRQITVADGAPDHDKRIKAILQYTYQRTAAL